MLEQLSGFIIHLIQSTGYFGIFILMTLESALIPLPSEVTMPFAGFLSEQGHLSLLFVAIVGAFGNLSGSLIAYGLGFYLEEKVIVGLVSNYGKFILLSRHEYETSMRWFRKYGEILTLVSRVLPGIRTFISLPAGLSQMNLKKFILYTFVGSFIWSYILASVGYYLGNNWHTIGPIFRKFDLVIAVFFLLAILLYFNRKLKIVKF